MQGECFTLLLTLFARLAPLQSRQIGMPGRGALSLRMDLSLAVFILSLLAAGSFGNCQHDDEYKVSSRCESHDYNRPRWEVKQRW